MASFSDRIYSLQTISNSSRVAAGDKVLLSNDDHNDVQATLRKQEIEQDLHSDDNVDVSQMIKVVNVAENNNHRIRWENQNHKHKRLHEPDNKSENSHTNASANSDDRTSHKGPFSDISSSKLVKMRLDYMYGIQVDDSISEKPPTSRKRSRKFETISMRTPMNDKVSYVSTKPDQTQQSEDGQKIVLSSSEVYQQLSNIEQDIRVVEDSPKCSQTMNDTTFHLTQQSFVDVDDTSNEDNEDYIEAKIDVAAKKDQYYYFEKSGWLFNTSHRNHKINRKLDFLEPLDGESTEEYNLRLRRLMATTEYASIRKQYRTRKYKLSEDHDGHDVGKAISNKVTEALKCLVKLKKEEDLMKNTNKDNTNPQWKNGFGKNDDSGQFQRQSDTSIRDPEAQISPPGQIEMDIELQAEENVDDLSDPLNHLYHQIKVENERSASQRAVEMAKTDDSVELGEDTNVIIQHVRKGNWKELMNLESSARGRLPGSTAVSSRKRLLLAMSKSNEDYTNKKIKNYFSSQRKTQSKKRRRKDEFETRTCANENTSIEQEQNGHILLRSLPKINKYSIHPPCRISYHQHTFPLYSFGTYGPYEHYRNVIRLAGRHVFATTAIDTLSQHKNNNDMFQDVEFDSEVKSDKLPIMDRLLHLLWHKSFRANHIPYHRVHCVINHAKSMGLRLRCFYKYAWKDRNEAAVALGVAGPRLSGYFVQSVGADTDIGKRFCNHSRSANRIRQYQGVVQALAERNQKTKLPLEIAWFDTISDSNKDLCCNQGTIDQSRHYKEEDSEVVRDFLKYFNVNQSLYKPRYIAEEWCPVHTSYRFIPGSVPPLPLSPLDEVGIIFGPVHQYDLVLIHGTMPEVTIKLTVATLLSKFTLQQDLTSHIQTQLQSAMSTAVDQNRRELIKMYRPIQFPLRQLPLACWYSTLMEYCSLLCNGYIQHPNDVSDDDADIDDDNCSIDVSHLKKVRYHRPAKAIAKEVVLFLEDIIDHNGLRMFPRIHIVYGIAQIAAGLPESAALLLMRNIDSNANPMPFTIFRTVLQQIENLGVIVTAENAVNDSLIAYDNLEYVMNLVSKRLAKQYENNPDDVESVCWLIGTLSSCLLLASGNRIGSGAHCFPSALEKHVGFVKSLDVAESDREELAQHEIRSPLPSYCEHKRKVLNTFQCLLHLAERSKSLRAHKAIASFLEWREVMAMLIGPFNDEEIERYTYDSIHRLHKYHSVCWMLTEGSNSKTTVKSFAEKNTRLHALASLLENNPYRKDNWIALAEELGFVQTIVNADQRYVLRHNSGSRDDPEKVSSLDSRPYHERWWGEDRYSWWKDTLLKPSIPSRATVPNPSPFKEATLLDILKAKLPQIKPRKLRVKVPGAGPDLDPISVRWIDDAIERLDQFSRDEQPPLIEREFLIDDLLPYPLHKTRRRKVSKLHLADFDFIGVESEVYEMLCYKTLILCHLFSPSDPEVLNMIEQLVYLSWEKNILHEDTNSYKALRWLHSMGIV